MLFNFCRIYVLAVVLLNAHANILFSLLRCYLPRCCATKHDLNSLTVYIIEVLKSERIQWILWTEQQKKNSLTEILWHICRETYDRKKRRTLYKCSQWIITAPVVLARITRKQIICCMHFINNFVFFFKGKSSFSRRCASFPFFDWLLDFYICFRHRLEIKSQKDASNFRHFSQTQN